ncbi:pyrimidine 5'-nucleotidase [Asticcacaulis tiandongensis]|uniref:pyrimidine 5'-nucleotidase n=1 Tax=Asticcacaulis tiandongensis TaxID=2565365 RepID=UPI00112C4E7A|nr:pyrimidine 5'-nucleotidase [Asticcacaulis tiandongensis]
MALTGRNLGHIDTWLFDLDNTLYPADCDVMPMISERMTAYVMRRIGLPRGEAYALQKKYLMEHGTTLAGLMANYEVDPHEFMDYVHDVSIDNVTPDPALNLAITALPGRKIVFTNADGRHATRLIEKLEMGHLFEDVFHLDHAGFVPKPNLATFQRLIDKHGVVAEKALFFEDSPKNLKPAHDLGMATVLVGPDAEANTDAFVHHRSPSLKAFLRI